MSSSFRASFPNLISFFDEFFSSKQNVSVQEVAKTVVMGFQFKRIHDLLLDIQRFNVSQSSPPIKTRDLLLAFNTDLQGLSPIDFLQHIQYALKTEMAAVLEMEEQLIKQLNENERKYYYLLKWEIELKRFFANIIQNEWENLSPVSLYVLTQPVLMALKWKDGELVDDMLGIKRTTKGHMNLTQHGNQVSLEKNQNFSLAFFDGVSNYLFSCNLQFIHNRPFYEFPPMLSYDDMAIIEKHWLTNFPLQDMLRELSN